MNNHLYYIQFITDNGSVMIKTSNKKESLFKIYNSFDDPEEYVIATNIYCY